MLRPVFKMVLSKSERNPGPNTKSNEFHCSLLGFKLSGDLPIGGIPIGIISK